MRWYFVASGCGVLAEGATATVKVRKNDDPRRSSRHPSVCPFEKRPPDRMKEAFTLSALSLTCEQPQVQGN